MKMFEFVSVKVELVEVMKEFVIGRKDAMVFEKLFEKLRMMNVELNGLIKVLEVEIEGEKKVMFEMC